MQGGWIRMQLGIKQKPGAICYRVLSTGLKKRPLGLQVQAGLKVGGGIVSQVLAFLPCREIAAFYYPFSCSPSGCSKTRRRTLDGLCPEVFPLQPCFHSSLPAFQPPSSRAPQGKWSLPNLASSATALLHLFSDFMCFKIALLVGAKTQQT